MIRASYFVVNKIKKVKIKQILVVIADLVLFVVDLPATWFYPVVLVNGIPSLYR